MPPHFLITIDVEGDNLWSRPRQPTTENARCLPAFQDLCERFGMRPTYLTNYEMASSPVYCEFARDVLRRDAGEVGMHLHAWDTPPLQPLTSDDTRFRPYLIQYPEHVIGDKVRFMTDLLETTFGRKMVSHRAGRWAFDGAYARALVENGYLVDCSVTPHVTWRHDPGAPGHGGGSDYSMAPETPYFVDLADVSRAGTSPLLEVPATVVASDSALLRITRAMASRVGGRAYAAVNRLVPSIWWLRPNGRNLNAMRKVLALKQANGAAHVEFMLHSSEFMPGGSPTFRTADSIRQLYDDMAELFTAAADFKPATLAEFRRAHVPRVV